MQKKTPQTAASLDIPRVQTVSWESTRYVFNGTVRGVASLINQGKTVDDNNMQFELVKVGRLSVPVYTAKHDIRRGEVLLVDYGNDDVLRVSDITVRLRNGVRSKSDFSEYSCARCSGCGVVLEVVSRIGFIKVRV